MHLGFVSAILPDQSLEEVLSFAASTGYACVELMCWPVGRAERRYAGVTHLDAAQFDASEARRTQDVLDAAGVTVSALGYYPNLLTPDIAASEVYGAHLRRVIEAARTLGVGVVNTFIGRDPARSVDDNWPRLREIWGPIIGFAEDQGVRIGIENCPMFFTQDEWPGGANLATSPAIWRRLFDEFPSPNLGLNYDPSHLVWQQMDYIKPLREFGLRLFHVHAKDAKIDRERLDDVGILATPLEYHSPKLPGLGDVDWGRFFSVLGDTGYRGPVCVEVEDRAFEESLEDRQRALRQAKAFLQSYVSSTKQTNMEKPK